MRFRGMVNSTIGRSPFFEILFQFFYGLGNVFDDALACGEHRDNADRIEWNGLVITEVGWRWSLLGTVCPLRCFGFLKSQSLLKDCVF